MRFSRFGSGGRGFVHQPLEFRDCRSAPKLLPLALRARPRKVSGSL